MLFPPGKGGGSVRKGRHGRPTLSCLHMRFPANAATYPVPRGGVLVVFNYSKWPYIKPLHPLSFLPPLPLISSTNPTGS